MAKKKNTGSEEARSAIRHAESRHLRMAATMSMVIAHAKQQTEIQLRDLIAGIYVANFERVAGFWKSGDGFGGEFQAARLFHVVRVGNKIDFLCAGTARRQQRSKAKQQDDDF